MPTLDVLGNGSCRHVLSILVPLCCCRLLVQTDHVFPRARSVLRLLLCRLQGLLRCPACSRQSLELIRRRLLCAGFPGSCFLRSCCMGSLLELGNLRSLLQALADIAVVAADTNKSFRQSATRGSGRTTSPKANTVRVSEPYCCT